MQNSIGFFGKSFAFQNTASIFGDGTAYGALTGTYTYSSGVWTITGATTVDQTDYVGVLRGRQFAMNGGSLAPPTNSKGTIIIMSESIELSSSAVLHINKLGKAGNFGDLSPADLIPAAMQAGLDLDGLATYAVSGDGANGGPGAMFPATPSSGSAAGSMQTGGGGAGVSENGNGNGTGAGGKGGPCCGGAGSGGTWTDVTETVAGAGDYGGPGGATNQNSSGYYGCAGAGDPVGTPRNGRGPADGAGGGLLYLIAPSITIASGCVVSADGGTGGSYSYATGGSAGGGCVCIVTSSGGYSNSGTVRANGGAGRYASSSGRTSGAGGAGSVNIFTV